MINGLAGSGPPLGLIAPEAKEWQAETAEPKEFRKALSAEEPEVEKSDPSMEQTLEPKKSVDLKVKVQRERAIRKFMDSIEGEFGIPPAKMVEAMAQLSKNDMQLSPQQTVNQVVARLGLEPGQAHQVKQLYKGLLNQLQQIEMRAQLPTSTDSWLSQLSFERQLGRQAQKSTQGESVQKLNREFWMQEPVVEGDLPRQDMQQALNLMDTPVDFKGLEKLSPDARVKTLQDLLLAVKEQVPEENVQVEDIQLSEVKEFKPEALAIPFIPRRPDLSQKLQIDEPKLENDSEVSLMDTSPLVAQATKAEDFELSLMKRMLGLSSVSEKTDEKAKPQDATVDTLASSLISADAVPLEKFDTTLVSQPTLQPSSPMTDTGKAENMKSLMDQAQVLIQKGGGEMKVEMSPEGMGAVQMKLKVLDGKVQLQMAAENKEVKKLIENSIQDLKSSLASHNLAVDQVRIDVVHQSMGSSDVRQDLQGQMNQFLNQQQKDGTRQFWQQFNENFGNRQARENFYDAQNIRRGATEQTLPGFSSSAPRSLGNGRGKSLNLVA